MQGIFGKTVLLCFALGVALLPVGASARAGASLEAWVSLPPQAFVVERIGGPEVAVRVLVGPGRSPATYAPTPSEVTALGRSDLFFGIGVPAERRMLERMEGVLESVRVVGHAEWVLENGPEGGFLHEHGHDHDHEGHGSACSIGGEDPHVWLDPQQMIAFADCVVRELSAVAPEAAGVFAERGAALQGELEALDRRIRERLAPYEGRAFFVNHPSLGHFAARYGLEQRSLERAGSTPSSRRVMEMVGEARVAGARAVLAQIQFSRSTADVLARALGVPVLEIDPLARDYGANLLRLTEQLLRAFGDPEAGEGRGP